MLRTVMPLAAPLAGCLVCLAVFQNAGAAEPAPPNREPLQDQPYVRLPLGSVRAKRWLRHQLELQRDGLTGHAEALYRDIGESDWISETNRGGQFAWERGPYYAKGLMALAYVLDDAGLKKKAQRWVDPVLASQRADGDFGPKGRNWWANMIVLHYLRDYCEATGDARVPPFFEKYFRFQLETLPSHPLMKDSKWAKARGGDNLEIVLWLYNRTGEAWLMDLARLLVEQTNEWHRYYAEGKGDNAYPQHIVNCMQGLKTPPLAYLVTGDAAHQRGFARFMDPDGWIRQKCGRIDGMVNGSEPLTDRSSTGGTELCAIVERILSNTVALKVLGDAAIGDRLERVAYNALPAALSPDIRGLRYYILPNQPKCTNENLGFRHNGKGKHAICPSPHSGYGCCRSNFHHGWPKFVHNMWMATADGGLALAAYGPNTVTAKVGRDGRAVTIDQATDYPFREDVTLTVTADKPVAFPLEVRIPGWCRRPEVRVNGKPVGEPKAGTFHRIERSWTAGDVVAIRLPMAPTVSRWINESVAVTRGPLVFSLLMQEQWKSSREFLDGTFHTWEIRPTGPWNYALVLSDLANPTIETTVAESVPAQPFKAADAPVRLTVRAARTDAGGWGTYRQDFPARAVEPPPSPVKTSPTAQTITLVPYGSTEIRVTHFPLASH
ncbi:MAG: glycoside hydrolase family 127 protein [Phycisphaerae bacterium]